MNNLTYVLIILLIIFVVKKYIDSKKSKAKIKEMLESGKKPFLLDVREPSEFANGTVHGAVNIPVGRLSSSLDKLKGKEPIIVFCQSGMRASQALNILKTAGITDVINGISVSMVEMQLKG